MDVTGQGGSGLTQAERIALFERARIALPEEFAVILENVVQTGTIPLADIDRHFPADSSNGDRTRFQGLLKRFKIKVIRYRVEQHVRPSELTEPQRTALLERYHPLVKYVVDRIASGLPKNVERGDLMNTAVIGLFEALEKYDASRGTKFETYAIWWIRGAVLDELRTMDWASRTTRRKAREVEKATQALEQKLGRPAADREVAEAMNMALRRFLAIKEEIRGLVLLSLDQSLQIDDEHDLDNLANLIEDAHAGDPVERMQEQEESLAMCRLIQRLPPEHRIVMALYYYEELSLKEIGEVMSISESRVSQLHIRAILFLQRWLWSKDQRTAKAVRKNRRRTAHVSTISNAQSLDAIRRRNGDSPAVTAETDHWLDYRKKAWLADRLRELGKRKYASLAREIETEATPKSAMLAVIDHFLLAQALRIKFGGIVE